MAWLENLAAGQGVSEEELISSPEDRSDTPPDWVQEMADDVEIDSEADSNGEDDIDHDVSLADTIETPIEIESAEMPDWLTDSLAEDGEVDEAELKEDELLAEDFDAVPEDIPNWLRETIEAEADDAAEEGIEDEFVDHEAETVVISTDSISDDSEKEPAIQDLPEEVVPVEIATEIPDEEEDAIEPPSWVTDEKGPADDEYTWLTPEVIDEVAESSGAMLNINKASLIQMERLPNMGFIRAQAVINYRDEHGEFSELDDMLKVPEIDEDILEGIRPIVMVAVTQPSKPATKPGTGPLVFPLEDEEPEDEFHALQQEGQIMLAEGDIDGALAQYGKLIKKGKRLDGVIDDLNQALYQVPMDVSVNVFQTLGDAYMRADRLQDALDMYTKAEELLR